MNIEIKNGLNVDIVHVNVDGKLNLMNIDQITASDWGMLDIQSI